jgi:hypothetical protein
VYWAALSSGSPASDLTFSFEAQHDGSRTRCGDTSPAAAAEGLREAAFRERRKIHDIVLEGIRLALGKRGRKQ